MLPSRRNLQMAVLTVLCGGVAFRAQAQIEIAPPDPDTHHGFGASVSLSGDGLTAAVGSACQGFSACDPGAVYVYSRVGDDWAFLQKLVEPAAQDGGNDRFGWTVRISADGRTILASDMSASGSVHVFALDESTWVYEATLSSPVPQYGSFGFGLSIGLSASGDTAMIGEYARSCPGFPYCGAAFVFRRTSTGWTPVANLVSPQPDNGGVFGWAVALSEDGTHALIGAPQERYGRVYEARADRHGVFSVVREVPRPPHGSLQDKYGFSVSLSADSRWAAVGAIDELCADGYNRCGAAYVLRANGPNWQILERFVSPSSVPVQEFGYSLSLDREGRSVLVGSDREGTPSWQGAAYRFVRRGMRWYLHAALHSPRPQRGAIFGQDVSQVTTTEGVTALVGAPGSSGPDDVLGSGAAYAYDFP